MTLLIFFLETDVCVFVCRLFVRFVLKSCLTHTHRARATITSLWKSLKIPSSKRKNYTTTNKGCCLLPRPQSFKREERDCLLLNFERKKEKKPKKGESCRQKRRWATKVVVALPPHAPARRREWCKRWTRMQITPRLVISRRVRRRRWTRYNRGTWNSIQFDSFFVCTPLSNGRFFPPLCANVNRRRLCAIEHRRRYAFGSFFVFCAFGVCAHKLGGWYRRHHHQHVVPPCTQFDKTNQHHSPTKI